MTYDVNNLQTWLKHTHHVNVANEWLRQTVVDIQSEIRNCTLSRIQDEVWKKWLSADLHLFPNSCLPKDLKSKTKQVVSGNFVLQIDEIRDISQSCYSQLMKITNQDEQNLDMAEKPNEPIKKDKITRVLKINLSDGVENVIGMEYKPISFLNNLIAPGSKICIHGHFICRLGTFLLTRDNVRFLGGGVQLLKEENTQDKVLARALGNDEILLRLSGNNGQNSENRNGNANIEPIDYFADDDFIDYDEIDRLENLAIRNDANSSIATRNVNNDINNQYNNYDENDEFDDDFIDWEELDKLEKLAMEKDGKSTTAIATTATESRNPKNTNCSTADKRKNSASSSTNNGDLELWNDMFEDDLDSHDFEVTPRAQLHRPPTKKPCLETEDDVKCTLKSVITIAKSSNLPMPSLRRNIFKTTVQLPFTYLQNVLAVPVSRRKKKFTVKGFFMTLTTALDHNSETKWSLEALINDGTTSLDVVLDNQVLEKLIGFKANEIRNLSRRAKYDLEIRRNLDEGFENCKTTLTNFTGFIDVEFSDGGVASVIKIRDLSEDDVRLIDLAVDDSLLPAEFQN